MLSSPIGRLNLLNWQFKSIYRNFFKISIGTLKKTRAFFFFPFLVVILWANPLYALRIGFLPVQVSRSAALVVQEQYPAVDAPTIAYQLAHLYQTVYQLSQSPQVFSLSEQRQIDALANSAYPFARSFTAEELYSIGSESNSEALFLSELAYHQQQKTFTLTTSLYYVSSRLQTDYVQVSCSKAAHCFFNALKKRFAKLALVQNKNLSPTESSSKETWIFMLDASGVNQKEIFTLAETVPRLPFAQAALCSGFAQGEISFTTMQDKQIFARTLQRLKTGGQEKSFSFAPLLACAQRQLDKISATQKKPRLIFLTGSMPADSVETRGLLRRLAAQSRMQIFTSSGLTREGREFWQNLAQELQYSGRAQHAEILYRQRVGLSDGQEVYIFKNGNLLVESFDANLDAQDFSTPVPVHKADRFLSSRLADFYQEMSQNRVVAQGKLEILFPSLVPDGDVSTDEISSPVKILRVLVSIESPIANMNAKDQFKEQKSFWLHLPASAQNMQLEKDQNYYFLVSLLPPQTGIPLANDASLGTTFFDKRQISSVLLLPIDEYLKSPSRFLQKSIDNSSWYYIFGQVKAVLR